MCIDVSHLPAIQAVMKQATLPAIIALSATLAKSERRSGAMAPSPPTCTPIDPKLAKPQSAYVDITSVLSYNNMEDVSVFQRLHLKKRAKCCFINLNVIINKLVAIIIIIIIYLASESYF